MKNLHCLPKRIIIKRAEATCGWGCGSGCGCECAQICGQTKQRPIISPSFDLARGGRL